MYLPSHFSAPDQDSVDALIRAYPLASVVFAQTHEPMLTVDPVVLISHDAVVPGGSLWGHVARANPLGQVEHEGVDITAIFMGPRAYISPNWYPSKQQHHRVVPTYNYCTVVVQGRLRRVDDAPEKLAIVRQLTQRLEGTGPQAWTVEDAPAAYIDAMLAAIVGIKIEVTAVQAKFKLSQNRDALDYGAVQMELEAHSQKSDVQVMATLMDSLHIHSTRDKKP